MPSGYPTGTRVTIDQETNAIIGSVLREVREDAGMTQDDVDRNTYGAISGKALGSYERGDRTVSLDKLLDLARVYQVPPDVLLSVIEKRCQR